MSKRVVGLLLFGVLAVAACGGGDDAADLTPTVPDPLPSNDGADADDTVMAPVGPTLTVAELLEVEGMGPFSVEGYLFVLADGRIVLSDAIAESYPPQPGEASVEVVGVDLQTVPLMEPTDPELADVRWTEVPIELVGSFDGEVFTGSTPAST
jgi:hypothetical protein